MAATPALKSHVLKAVAASAATALAGLDHLIATRLSSSGPGLHLHESLPIWLIDGKHLERLRKDRSEGSVKLRKYMRRTRLWLHLLYRDGEPLGYAHGRAGARGRHDVTNVSVTREAHHIRQAIEAIDRAAPAGAIEAGILECPKVGLAGVIVFPKRRGEEPRLALFREPSVPSAAGPRVMPAEALVDELLHLRVLRGPTPQGRRRAWGRTSVSRSKRKRQKSRR